MIGIEDDNFAFGSQTILQNSTNASSAIEFSDIYAKNIKLSTEGTTFTGMLKNRTPWTSISSTKHVIQILTNYVEQNGVLVAGSTVRALSTSNLDTYTGLIIDDAIVVKLEKGDRESIRRSLLILGLHNWRVRQSV